MVYGILNRCNRWIANIHNCDSNRRSIILLKIYKKSKTKNSLGVIPNVVKIIMKNNDVFKFSVFKRADWITEINKMRNDLYKPADD